MRVFAVKLILSNKQKYEPRPRIHVCDEFADFSSSQGKNGQEEETLYSAVSFGISVMIHTLFLWTVMQYSDISGRLKHPFSLTPIDRYSLGKLMCKSSVGYDFTLARYAE